MMSERRRSVAIIGQGLMGLTCADRLLDSGFEVDIFSKDDFWQTASISAGAYWWPHRVYPEKRVAKWSQETYYVYAEEKNNPQSGISFQQHLRFCLDPDDSAYALHLVDEWEEVNGHDYGLDCPQALLVTLPVIDVPTYMPYLRSQVENKGGQIRLEEVNSLQQFFPAYDLVVNCSGAGARQLANDEEVFPIRGQVVRVAPCSEITRSTRIYQKKDEFTLVLPRRNDIVLGGTAQDNDWSLDIRETDTKDIINRCAKIVPTVKKCEILGATVGLRCARSEVRLELELFSGSGPVIHNYGHGGGGYTVAWGCANEVQRLAEARFC